MKQECQIVQDLFPLYEEELASEGSAAFIKAHCSTCETCKRIMVRSMELEEVVKEDISELGIKRAINKAKLKRGLIYILGLILICTLAGLATVGHEYQRYSKDGFAYIQENIHSRSGMGVYTDHPIINIDLYDLSKNNNKVIAKSKEHTLWINDIYLKEETENNYIYALECKTDVNYSFAGASLLEISLGNYVPYVIDSQFNRKDKALATLNGEKIVFQEENVGIKGWWEDMPKETFNMSIIVDKENHPLIKEGDIVTLNTSEIITEWDLDNTSEILKTAVYGMGIGALIFILGSILFYCFRLILLKRKS